MLRIQRAANGKVCFSLSGRMESGDVDALRKLIGEERSGKKIVLNLRELLLVDSDAMEFLAECEAGKIVLEQCPGFVRTWIDQWQAPAVGTQPASRLDSPAPSSPGAENRTKIGNARSRRSRKAGTSNE